MLPNFQHMVGLKPVKVIAVASGKGGVGKSCIAANLAVALAQMNKKVLLMDADLAFPNLDIMLGLESRYNLSHVVQGSCALQDILLPGPAGISVIPGATCNDYMTQLTSLEYAGIIDAFNSLTGNWDYMIVDTAPGIVESNLHFTRSSQDIIVVVSDEPASLAATYAYIKYMHKHYHWQKFHILTNMTTKKSEGLTVFQKILKITDQFLQVNLNYLGSVPLDSNIRKTLKKQKPIVLAMPDSLAARALMKISVAIDEWPIKSMMEANTSFFLERLQAG